MRPLHNFALCHLLADSFRLECLSKTGQDLACGSQHQQLHHQNSENTIQFIPSFISPSPPHFEHPPTFGSNFSAPLSPKLVPVAQRIANIERTSDNNLRSFPEISITEINVTAITGDTLNESEELIFIDRSESSTAWL